LYFMMMMSFICSCRKKKEERAHQPGTHASVAH
jgi:hypothetical protein